MKKKFIIYFVSLSTFIFIISIIRSLKIGINCDEAITYLLFVIKKWTFSTNLMANNHLLNTFLVMLITFITQLSYNIFILRVPNLLFYLMYIFYTYKLSTLYKNRVTIASVLLLNYSINEFFSLARGYGIASAFIVAGIYYYKLYLKNKSPKNLKISIIHFFMSSLANTINLIPTAIFLLDAIIRMKKEKKLKQIFTKERKCVLFIIVIFLLLLSYHFFASFSDGSIEYAMCHKDLFSCLIYSPIKYYGLDFINKQIICIIVIFLSLLFIFYYKKLKINSDNLFYISISIYAVLILCKIIFPFELPTGRTLISFIAIYIISLADFIQLFYNKFLYKSINLLIIFLCFLSFFRNLSVNYTREWKSDYKIKQLVERKYQEKNLIKPNEIQKKQHVILQFYYHQYKKNYNYKLMTDRDYRKLFK